MATVDELFEGAMKLDDADRARLAEMIWHSVPEPLAQPPSSEEQWARTQELNEAWSDYRAGRDEAITWEQAKSEFLSSDDDDV